MIPLCSIPRPLPDPPPSNTSSNLSSHHFPSSDVYIGFHGHNPLLLRFSDWLRAEFESQGLSCFLTDRSRCRRNSCKHALFQKAMESSAFGVVILIVDSFANLYTIDELRFFSRKRNLVPIYFDLGPDDCLIHDIIERRGEIWEDYGGKLWLLYDVDNERHWREAVSALLRSDDDWKLDLPVHNFTLHLFYTSLFHFFLSLQNPIPNQVSRFRTPMMVKKSTHLSYVESNCPP